MMKSAYILEIAAEPGGLRRAEAFVYNDIDHIIDIIQQAFQIHSASDATDEEFDTRFCLDAIQLWCIHSGSVVDLIDISSLIKIGLYHKDKGKNRWTLDRILEAKLNNETQLTKHLETTEIGNVHFEKEQFRSQVKPLPPPLLAHSESTKIEMNTNRWQPKFSYFVERVRKPKIALYTPVGNMVAEKQSFEWRQRIFSATYGFTDLDGSENVPFFDFTDPESKKES